MRRRTRRALVNLTIFATVLTLIIYLNTPRSPTRSNFAWTTVRYKSSSSVPAARGICPGLTTTTKPVLVVARVQAEDHTWLDGLSARYHVCIYTADAPPRATSTQLQIPANKGHEAMVYLTFLIDNYAFLPPAGVVFVHGSRWAWHNDDPIYDNRALLNALNVSAALEPAGYHNLRCDWSAGTCDARDAPPQRSIETATRAVLEPWNLRAASDAALPGIIAHIFGGRLSSRRIDADDADEEAAGVRVLLGRTDAVRAQCCAQFVVSRHRIWQHTRQEYVALRQWLLDETREGDGAAAAAAAKQRLRANPAPGRVLSYVWHILFLGMDETVSSVDLDAGPDGGHVGGEGGRGLVNLHRLNELACPRADECYCRLYGRCKLSNCGTPGRCRGQYRLPLGLKLPEDWAETHE